MKKLLWVRADYSRPWEERKKLVTSALESGADAVVVRDGEEEKVRELGKIAVVSEGGGADIVLFSDVAAAEVSKSKSALFREIKTKDDEVALSSVGGRVDYIVVKAVDWKVIPLENLIAALRNRSKLLADVSSVDEAKLALETLEVGVDGILFSGSVADIKAVKELMDSIESIKLSLSAAEVRGVKAVGMGDRVCVDTCSMFVGAEGMLVGSQSNAFFLVHAENIETPYVAPRPFRVNAGAVHSYVLGPDGRTRYLSELASGDEVLAVDFRGVGRPMIAGRCKIERRPLILVEAEAGGKVFSVVLQNAETIRLVSPEGKPISVAALKPGDSVLVYLEEGGRHFGIKIKETIKEK